MGMRTKMGDLYTNILKVLKLNDEYSKKHLIRFIYFFFLDVIISNEFVFLYFTIGSFDK